MVVLAAGFLAVNCLAAGFLAAGFRSAGLAVLIVSAGAIVCASVRDVSMTLEGLDISEVMIGLSSPLLILVSRSLLST